MWLVESKPIRSNVTIPTTSFLCTFFHKLCHVPWSLWHHFIIPFSINSQYFKMWGVDSSGIHLIEKTSLEKYKPWTMGPNGFMGRTLLALQILFRNVYFIQAFGNDAQGSKLMLANSQNVGDFDNLRVRKISTSKCLRVRIIHVSQTKGENLLTVTDVSITCAVFIFWVTLKMNTTDCWNTSDCQQ